MVEQGNKIRWQGERLEINLAIDAYPTPLDQPVECCSEVTTFKPFTHTFERGIVYVEIPGVWGYECARCNTRYIPDDAAQAINRKGEMISRVLHPRRVQDDEAIEELGSEIVSTLSRYATSD